MTSILQGTAKKRAAPELLIHTAARREQIIDNMEKRRARTMSRKWKLRKGKVLVVEDADTASIVIVARDLKNREDKIAALEEVLRKMRA